MNTLFSIVIPCYNQAHFLPQCLDSLLLQEYKNWEAIVVNDGSPDTTNEVVQKYSVIDSRIKLVVKENGGLSSARNFGIKHALGERFIFLDADDLLLNNCLLLYHTILNENIEFIQSGYLCFKNKSANILYKRKNISPYSNFKETVLNANIGPVNGFVVSKNMIQKVGLFNESLTSCEDWDFWIRCAKLGFTPRIVNEIGAAYRFVPGSMGKNSLRMLEQGLRVINSHHLNCDSITIDFESLESNESYRDASIGHLVFATGISLFNNHEDFLKIIKTNYFEKIPVKLSNVVFNKFSNYQTYRDFGVFTYFLFYHKCKRRYHSFFKFLESIDLINKKKSNIFLEEVLPNPFRLIGQKLLKKINKF